jgi:hypothetical protein
LVARQPSDHSSVAPSIRYVIAIQIACYARGFENGKIIKKEGYSYVKVEATLEAMEHKMLREKLA